VNEKHTAPQSFTAPHHPKEDTMKYRTGLLVAFAALAHFTFAADHIDSVFKIGVNWLTFNASMNGGNYKRLLVDSLGFNVFHTDYPYNALSFQPAAAAGASKFIAEDGNNRPIYWYSGGNIDWNVGGFIKYEATDTIGALSDTNRLKRFYFIRKDTSIGHRYPPAPDPETHWEISASSDSSDVTVLDSNEIFNGTYPYTGMWKSTYRQVFRLAVKMQVDSLRSTNLPVISISIIAHKHLWRAIDTFPYTMVYTWNVPWNAFDTTGTDFVVFSDTFSLPIDFRPWDTIYAKGFDCDLKLTVTTKRYATTRIKWVTIMDTVALNLLGGTTYLDEHLHDNFGARFRPGPSLKTDLVKMSDTTIRRMILASWDSMSARLGSDLWAAYLSDEPRVSQFVAQARVTEILRSAGHPSETERSNPYEAQRVPG
jgi:hypothetical protein